MDAETFNKRFIEAMSVMAANAQAKFVAFGGKPEDYLLDYEMGQRYIRLVKTHGGQQSAYGFVDRTNGDILKAAGWKAPAKNFARGNIFKDLELLKKFGWTSIQ